MYHAIPRNGSTKRKFYDGWEEESCDVLQYGGEGSCRSRNQTETCTAWLCLRIKRGSNLSVCYSIFVSVSFDYLFDPIFRQYLESGEAEVKAEEAVQILSDNYVGFVDLINIATDWLDMLQESKKASSSNLNQQQNLSNQSSPTASDKVEASWFA